MAPQNPFADAASIPTSDPRDLRLVLAMSLLSREFGGEFGFDLTNDNFGGADPAHPTRIALVQKAIENSLRVTDMFLEAARR